MYDDRQMIDASQVAYDDYDKVRDAIVNDETFVGDVNALTISDMYQFATDPTRINTQVPGTKQTYADLVQATTDMIGESSKATVMGRIGDWKIVDYENDNGSDGSGLYACVIETAPTEAIIAFRGTEGELNDLIASDLGLLNSAQTSQQAAVGRYIKRLDAEGLDKKYSGWLASAGHSLGGNDGIDAVLQGIRIGFRIDQCVALDAPGFPNEYVLDNMVEILALPPGTITKYRWSPVGRLLWDIPGITIKNAKSKDYGKFSVGRGGVFDGLPDFFFGPLKVHDSRSPELDENNMIVEGNNLDDIFDFNVGVTSRLVDINPWVALLTSSYTAYSFINKHKDEVLKRIDEAAQRARDALGALFVFRAALEQAAADLAISFASKVAALLAIQQVAAQQAANFIQDSAKISIDNFEAGLQVIANACKLSQKEVREVAERVSLSAFNILRAQGTFGGLKHKVAASPSIRDLVTSFCSTINSHVDFAKLAAKGNAVHDFSETTKQQVLAVMDEFERETPFDATCWTSWPVIVNGCNELCPDALPYFTQILDFHAEFNALNHACKGELNRVFDEAQILDAEYAKKIRDDAAKIRHVAQQFSQIATNLTTAAAQMKS